MGCRITIVGCVMHDNPLTLRGFITSLLTQTDGHWRAIIVTDEVHTSAQIEIKKNLNDERISYMRIGDYTSGLPWRGVSLNCGVSKCCTEYAVLTDVNAYCLPIMVAKLSGVLDSDPDMVYYGGLRNAGVYLCTRYFLGSFAIRVNLLKEIGVPLTNDGNKIISGIEKRLQVTRGAKLSCGYVDESLIVSNE